MPTQSVHLRLSGLLQFVIHLIASVNELTSLLKYPESNYTILATKCELIIHLLLKANDFFLSDFNNIIDEVLTSTLFIVVSTRVFLFELSEYQKVSTPDIFQRVVGFECEQSSYQKETLQFAKDRSIDQEQKNLYENVLLWLVQAQRMRRNVDQSIEVKVHALDHIVRREVSKKLAQEQELDDAEAQVLNLPFRMKVQSLMEDNKAIDEMTRKDKEEKQKEDDAEIEVNFPSYFDEFQKNLLNLSSIKDKKMYLNRDEKVEVTHREITYDQMLLELCEVNNVEEDSFRSEFLRLRLEIVQMSLEQSETISLKGTKHKRPPTVLVSQVQSFTERDHSWMEDAVCCLQDQIEQARLRSVMNISELTLPSTYNFYHDPIATEARLMY